MLRPLLKANPRFGYALLFAAASETLQEVAQTPRNLGARIGITAVLHTWSQTLQFHPHIHCIVTGGGLSRDRKRWVAAKPRFLFALAILRRVYRGKLLSKLKRALDTGKLSCKSGTDASDALRQAASKDWVVYSKPPLAGPEQVLRYLGRYTHRVAISNDRVVSMRDDQVTFRWRDRRRDSQVKLMTLDAVEFLRRYLQHILPPGFMRIRHYGLLANACRKQLGVTQKLLAAPCSEANDSESWQELLLRVTGQDVTLCPRCRSGHLQTVEEIQPSRGQAPPPQRRARAP